MVLRKMFGPKRDKVTGDWRKLRIECLHGFFSSPNIIQVIKSNGAGWAGYRARMWEKISAYKVLVAKPEGKRLLGRPRRRWEDNIEMDLRKTGVGRV
jgi:hypothetical protein